MSCSYLIACHSLYLSLYLPPSSSLHAIIPLSFPLYLTTSNLHSSLIPVSISLCFPSLFLHLLHLSLPPPPSISVLPPLEDLHLKPMGQDSARVEWRGRAEIVQGYWVSWDGARPSPSRQPSSSSSLYLPSDSGSTVLTNLAPNSRVCVSPVYRTARGQGLCCTHTHSGLNVNIAHSHMLEIVIGRYAHILYAKKNICIS